MFEMQGARTLSTQLQQAGETFKHQSSLREQVYLAEHTNHITPETSAHPPSSRSSDTINSRTAVQVPATSIHSDSDRSSSSAYQIASVQASGRLIKLSGLVNKCQAVMMVDSGSTGDFISEAYVSKYSIH